VTVHQWMHVPVRRVKTALSAKPRATHTSVCVIVGSQVMSVKPFESSLELFIGSFQNSTHPRIAFNKILKSIRESEYTL